MIDLFTERLHLRKLSPADYFHLYKIWSDPEVTKHMNITPFRNEKETLEMIRNFVKLAQIKKALRYTIVETETNQIIGSCGYNLFDFESSKTEIGCELAKEHWGNGFATEAVSALLDYAFFPLDFQRVEAKVEPKNINSIKALDKLGFIYEDTSREYEKRKKEFITLNLYSKLKTDWAKDEAINSFRK